MHKRPKYFAAKNAVRRFLLEIFKEEPHFNIVRDGDDGWAFWILETDTTSYVHHDLIIEWYGTSWEDGQDRGDI